MPEFSSGVKEYIRASAIVEVSFPVDFHDRADVSCSQCPYFRYTIRHCGLNDKICEYPERYIGSHCPLTFYSPDKENDKEDKEK